MTVRCRQSWFYTYLLFFLFFSVFSQTGLSANFRSKRSLIQFSNMIRIATNNDDPMRFNNYGYHCGAGSKDVNALPVDEIDACCHQHDFCYERLTTGPCYWSNFGWSHSPYYNVYTWIVPNGNIICVDFDNHCKLATCNCDREAAQCFALHSVKYNETHKQSNFPMMIVESMWSKTQKFFNWFF